MKCRKCNKDLDPFSDDTLNELCWDHSPVNSETIKEPESMKAEEYFKKRIGIKAKEQYRIDTLMCVELMDMYASHVLSERMPSDEDFEKWLEDYAFQVPYDGTDKFYNEGRLKNCRYMWKWLKQQLKQ